MLPFEDRYSRQRRLAEVGPTGQAKLEQARMLVSSNTAGGGQLELLYLRRAGVGRATLSKIQPAPAFPHQQTFRFEATRSVAANTWGALAQLRRELGLQAGNLPAGKPGSGNAR